MATFANSNTLTLTPNKTLTTKQKIILSFSCLSTNVGWALSESLIIPYLLIVGAPLYVCSWVWFFSPLLSSYIAPKIDNICDNWSKTNCWGWKGRKQIILILSVISFITMLLLPQSNNITIFIFQTNNISLIFIISIIIFTIMDISFYLLLRPLQSLIWDVTMGNKEVYMDTMKIFNIIQGICRMFGLIIVAISISFEFAFAGSMNHIASAFTLAAILILIGTFFSLFYSPNTPEIDTNIIDNDNDVIDHDLNGIPYLNSSYTSNLCTNIEYDYDNNEYMNLLNVDNYGSTSVIDEYDTDEDDDIAMLVTKDGSESASGVMYPLYILWFSQLCGWCSMCSVILFWTSFISIDIYNGIPVNILINHSSTSNINLDSYSWLKFKAGLVYGAYGLLLTSLVSVNCSILYPYFRKKISLNVMYLCGEYSMSIACILFYLIMNETLLLILISIFGAIMQIHMQSCHELTENKLIKMFQKIREYKHNKIYFEYFMELTNVIAPVIVSLFGGPIVYGFNGQFKYLFLIIGSIQLIVDFVVMLLFCNVLPWKLK